MRLNDALIGAVLIALAIALAVYSQTFPDIPGQQYGAAVFPTLIALGLAGSGLALVVSGVRQRAPIVVWADWARERHGIRNVAVTVLAVAFYVLAANRLGFIPTMAIALFVLLKLFRVGAVLSVAVAVGATLLIQYLFADVLYVPLPWGVLEPFRW
jgi:putative tricarboxylic transport membrane protein